MVSPIFLLLQSSNSFQVQRLKAVGLGLLIGRELLVVWLVADSGLADVHNDDPPGLDVARMIHLFWEGDADLGDRTRWRGRVGRIEEHLLFLQDVVGLKTGVYPAVSRSRR